MKIALLTNHVDIGGITSYLVTVAGGLKARGHDVRIVSGGGALVEGFEAAGIPHHTVPLRKKFELHPQLWLAARQMRRILRQHPIDVLHAQTRVTQVWGTWLARQLHVPLVSTWHGFFRPHWGRRMLPCVGDLVIAISPAVEQHLRTKFHVPADRITLIEHGIAVEQFQAPSAEMKRTLRQEFGLPDDAYVIGSVARLVPDKGLDRLVRVVATLAPHYPQLRLVLVGSGPEERMLRELAATLGVTNRILMLGSQAELRAPLSVMDTFVFPVLRREGFGLVLLEAMAMELPVIATTQPALTHILDEGRAGVLVPPDDVRALAAAVARLIERPAEAKQLALRGFARVQSAYTVERMLNQLEAAYARVRIGAHVANSARSA